MATEEGTLERELGDLLEQERFEPPEDFVKDALVTDLSMHEEAERDPAGWWLKQSKELLHWFEEPSTALDDSNPPFYKWFTDGKPNASYNCLDRHVEAGNGHPVAFPSRGQGGEAGTSERVPFRWGGEEGEEREVPYADLHRDVQRFANALPDHGIEKCDVV